MVDGRGAKRPLSSSGGDASHDAKYIVVNVHKSALREHQTTKLSLFTICSLL